MAARENILKSEDASSLDSLEALMKKRDGLDKIIAAQVIKANIRVPIITISANKIDVTHVCMFIIFKYFDSYLLLTENSGAGRAFDTVSLKLLVAIVFSYQKLLF